MIFNKIWNFYILYLDFGKLPVVIPNEKDWYIFRNSDNSRGGLVTTSSKIGKNVFIDKTATVAPNVNVPDNTYIGKCETYFG